MEKLTRRGFIKVSGGLSLGGLFPASAIPGPDNGGDVLFLKEGDTLYDTFRQGFNKRVQRRPRVIAVCRSEAGVQKAVQYAKKQALPVAVKSGGHSFEGFSLNNDGLVIDVSQMDQIGLDTEGRLIAQPGVKLVQLYTKLLPQGRLLPTGSCATVGLSGITLGGGYGLFSRQFGLTCDWLTGVRMVNAQGHVVDSDNVPDLLWGCRGGGNGNFGVITQLRYNTVKAPDTLHQHRFRSFELSPDKAVELTGFWFRNTRHLPSHAFSAVIFGGRTLTVMFTSTEHDTAMRKVLERFNDKMDKNYNLKPDPIEIGVSYYYGQTKALYFKNASGGFLKNFDEIADNLKEVFSITAGTPGMIYQINTLGGAITTSGETVQSAYAHRDANYLAEIQCYWDDPAQESRSVRSVGKAQALLADAGVNRHYRNYPDINIPDYGEAYYRGSYRRLQALKQKLDPENLFSYEQAVQLPSRAGKHP